MSRVYIPSAQTFGTVTGSRSCGFLNAVTYLQVRIDGGETVSVLNTATVPADNAPVMDPLNSGNVVPFQRRPARPITMPDGSGPSAA